MSSSDASETWSPVHGAPWLIVDAREALPPADEVLVARMRAGLATLPCPTIALAASPAALGPLADAFDVVVPSDGDAALVTAGIARAPLAAATLVQTLRATATLPIADALVVESLAYATLQAGPEHAAWLAARAAPVAIAEPARSVVTLAEEDGALVVTLARPERHNAFSARMRDELVAALDLALADEPRPLVLRGLGPSFCSGGDLDEFGTRPDPATAHLVRTTRSPARLLAAVAPRLRAEVHGACIGAGVELAALATRVVARADAFFQLPEIGMGLVPGAGGTASLPPRIGRQRTAELALSGRRLDVRTAKAWGLVDEIVATCASP